MTNCGWLESIHCSHIPSDILNFIFYEHETYNISKITDTCYSSLKCSKQLLNSIVENFTTNKNISLNNLNILS